MSDKHPRSPPVTLEPKSDPEGPGREPSTRNDVLRGPSAVDARWMAVHFDSFHIDEPDPDCPICHKDGTTHEDRVNRQDRPETPSVVSWTPPSERTDQ